MVVSVTGAGDGVEEGVGDDGSYNNRCGNMGAIVTVEEGALLDDSACNNDGCESMRGISFLARLPDLTGGQKENKKMLATKNLQMYGWGVHANEMHA